MKTKTIFEELRQELFLQKKDVFHPAIVWNFSQYKISGSYEVKLNKKIITVSFNGYDAAISALDHIENANQANLFGTYQEKILLRPVIIPPEWVEYLKDEKKLHSTCKILWKLKINAIILQEVDVEGFKEVLESLKSYGLKVILKTKFLGEVHSPFSKDYKNKIKDYAFLLSKKNIPYDYLFFQSLQKYWNLSEDLVGMDKTLLEALQYEVEIIEKQFLSKKILFYIPAFENEDEKSYEKNLLKLALELKSNTKLVFSAIYGDYSKNNLAANPLWQVLSAFPEMAYNFLPILNTSFGVDEKQYFPILQPSLVDEYLARQLPFFGVICNMTHLPKQGGLDYCNFWLIAQTLKEQGPASMLLEKWFKKYKSDWNYKNMRYLFEKIGQIAKACSYYQELTNESHTHQELRVLAESLLMQLNELEIHVNKDKYTGSAFINYFKLFQNEIKDCLERKAKQLNVSISHTVKLSDVKEDLSKLKEQLFDENYYF